MGLYINTNQSALNAQRKLTTTSNALGRSFERLSSGLRINGARDDAAGLSISNRFTAQVRGLNQAVRNSNDGISLAQTAEGALSETTNILQRIRELAVQSANDTNNSADRASLQAEVKQLVSELDRIATTTNFNGNKLLDGSYLSRDLQVGANVGETLSVSVAAAGTDDLARQARYTNDTTKDLATGLTINDTAIRDTVAADDQTSSYLNERSALAKAAAINDSSESTGVRAIVGQTEVVAAGAITGVTLDEDTYITINGVDIAGVAIESADATGALTDAINAESSKTGVVASQSKEGFLKLTAADGRNIHVSFSDANINTFAGKLGFTSAVDAAVTESVQITAATTAAGNFTDFEVAGYTITTANASASDAATEINDSADLQLLGITATANGEDLVISGLDTFTTASGTSAASGGAAVSSRMIVAMADITLQSEENFTVSSGAAIGFSTTEGIYGTNAKNSVANLDIGSREGAIKALDIVDLAIENVSASRAALGALQNRLESTINNLSTTSENLAASRSRIMDADFAAETANLSRNQIIQQAGVSILAQANQQPQIALALLG